MLRPWDLQIVIERGPVPAWSQIADALIEAIRRGRLAPGTALPGTRVLAERLNVNRKTVGQAYEELIAQGWLTAEATRGTFVSAMLPIVEAETITASATVQRKAFELRGAAPDLVVSLTGPEILRFDDGTPDTRLMPAELVARAYRRALLGRARRNHLGYGDPRGTLALREAVAGMLRADRGLNCSADNICITRGSQMGIYLAAKLLAGPGDDVGIEALSYPPARAAFVAAGAEIVRIGLDAQGMQMEALEAICRAKALRAIYITPHHQFPTTVVLPQQRRLQLLALADQFGFAIIEDDYDHEFHFGHRPMLPLASAHGFERLIYIGSLSKLFSPSLRIGYLVAAEDVVDRAAAEIMLIDRQGDPVTEAAAAELMVTGALKSHTRKVLRIYAQRRELLAKLLTEQLHGDAEFTLPLGGLAVWVNFADNIDVTRSAKAALQLGLEFTPGQRFATNGVTTNGARLGFAGLDDQELKRAVERLAEAVRTSPRRDAPSELTR